MTSNNLFKLLLIRTAECSGEFWASVFTELLQLRYIWCHSTRVFVWTLTEPLEKADFLFFSEFILRFLGSMSCYIKTLLLRLSWQITTLLLSCRIFFEKRGNSFSFLWDEVVKALSPHGESWCSHHRGSALGWFDVGKLCSFLCHARFPRCSLAKFKHAATFVCIYFETTVTVCATMYSW